MKKLLVTACTFALLLAGCGQPVASQPQDEDTLHIVATTYPVYLFTTAVTEGAEGVEVSLLVNQQTSCLHDYTLTVNDMKAIEGADVIIMNGAGLEDFMDDALSSSNAQVIDCAEGIDLLEAAGHEGHDHDTEYDPHIWMDPANAQAMLGTIADQLGQITGQDLQTRCTEVQQQVAQADQQWKDQLSALSAPKLITFHDGFQYFSRSFGLELLKAIEEEEGAEASAAEIKEIVSLVEQHQLPAIFTEVNGSDSTAQAISRETGCQVYQLTMIMSGDGTGIQPYLDAMQNNIDTIVEAFG